MSNYSSPIQLPQAQTISPKQFRQIMGCLGEDQGQPRTTATLKVAQVFGGTNAASWASAVPRGLARSARRVNYPAPASTPMLARMKAASSPAPAPGSRSRAAMTTKELCVKIRRHRLGAPGGGAPGLVAMGQLGRDGLDEVRLFSGERLSVGVYHRVVPGQDGRRSRTGTWDALMPAGEEATKVTKSWALHYLAAIPVFAIPAGARYLGRQAPHDSYRAASPHSSLYVSNHFFSKLRLVAPCAPRISEP